MNYENHSLEEIYNGFAIVRAQQIGRIMEKDYEFLIYLPEDVDGAKELQENDENLGIVLGEEYYHDWEAGTIEEAHDWIDCYESEETNDI